jgi:hypothetical protein
MERGTGALQLELPTESADSERPGDGVVKNVKEHVALGLGAVKDFMGVNLLTSLLVGWVAVRLCAPDALHLAWDSGTIEIVFGVIFPLTCVRSVWASNSAGAAGWDQVLLTHLPLFCCCRYAIGQSFTRREKAVDILAQMKTAALSLWLLFRDQDQAASEGQAKPGVGGVLAANVAAVLEDLLCSARGYLSAEHQGRAGSETEESQVYLNRIAVAHSTLSVLNEKLVFKGNQANGCIGRVDEYRRVLMLGFEQLRALRSYQSSPVRMQKFCVVMVHLAPIFLAPYWRHYCHEFNEKLGIRPQRVCIPAYLSCTVFVSVLCTLLRVAVDIADPWDGVGADDICFLVPEEVEAATHASPLGFDEHGRVQFTWTHGLSAPKRHSSDGGAAHPAIMQLRRMSSILTRRSVDAVQGAPAGAGEEESDALLNARHRHHPAGSSSSSADVALRDAT